MREKIIRDELRSAGLEVVDVTEEPRWLRVSVEYEGSEAELRDRIPDHYIIDSAVESGDGITAMLRHEV